MLSFCTFILWQSQISMIHSSNMYHTNIDHQKDWYCLLHYVQNDIDEIFESYIQSHQIIPYCLRLLDSHVLLDNFHNTIDTNFTFASLKEKNISSKQLLSWSAPIDLVEQYEMFLNNISYRTFLENDTIFYNCTVPWFGPYCRFAFDQVNHSSLNNVVKLYFQSKLKILTGNKVTCYEHLHCKTSLLCLDWREICDRKMDCVDGSDEIDCWQLEINECTENSYRCHNGQCIPMEFFHDNPIDPDCLDQTDEPRSPYYPGICYKDPAFRCEEQTSRSRNKLFPCGDGDYSIKTDFQCQNGRDNIQSNDSCSKAIMCAMIYHNLIDNELYEEFCGELKTHVINQCPLLFNFSELILFNHVYLLFEMNQINRDHLSISSPNYVCYNEQLCPDFPLPTINSNYSKCRLFDELGLEDREYFPELLDNINERFHTCLILPNDTHYCHHSTMYQCMNSTKCISKYRLVDGIRDCPFNDDETFNQSCSLSNVKHRFECLVNGTKTCLAPLMIEDHFSDCDNSEDEDSEDMKFLRNHITFSTICDGKEDLTPVFIDEQYETDETECEYWPCNNTYSRCDGFWLCRDGADEVNCLPSTCPEFQYNCVYPNDTTNLACLTINQIGDGFIDCLGASDERVFYRQGKSDIFWHNFKCSNEPKLINSSSFCNNKSECLFGDDEKFCTHYGYMYRYNCHYGNLSLLTEVEQFFCYNYHVFRRSPKIYFKLHSMPNYSIQSITAYDSSVSIIQEVTSSIRSNSIENIKHVDGWICNRGIGIYIRSDINQSKFYCLCPPSYYGDRCEYQNQRVSITLQVRIIYDWRIVFSFIIMLIDNDGHIESHDHIDYLSIRDCDIKFHLNLLYSSRPKNQTKNYSVRIDTFNKLTLQYRASWLFPFLFPFLPVHRLSLLLILPSHNILSHKQCTPSCIHGYCYHYINQPNLTFCRCESKWSGVRCDIANQCDCASDSVCLTDSICVCPLHRYGPRCYLRHSVCHSKSCDNNGKCIPNDERHTSTDEYQSTCICPLEYSGKQCKYRQTRIDIKFDNQIEITATLFLHFITLKDQIEPIRLSIMKKITWDQTLLTLYTSIQFNLAFAEIFNKLYLIIFQEEIIISAFITTKIRPSHRCFSIDELFNETIVNRKLLRRIKHYHIPCREQSDLMCFYDAFYLCLCDQFRRAYCFAFDHKMTYNCSGYDICENGGLCFQDDFKCPISFQCICPKCYYGSRCQFSTKESTLSLDAIIGYQIYQNTPVHRQPLVIQITMSVIITMFFIGFISNFLSLLAFQTQTARYVGCGIYLFVLCIVSMITLSLLVVKFLFLLTSQMDLINHHAFLLVQCIFVDFLLRVLVSSGDWLSVCVAIERTSNVLRGIQFNPTKSKQIAKWIIPLVILFTCCTHTHDPLHRHVIDDIEEQRKWCVTKYSSSLQTFDLFINILHFSFPFAINFLSAFIIIIKLAHTRAKITEKRSYGEVLRKELNKHKSILISPCIIVILIFPRLFMSILADCMESARNPWFYLIGYLIPFIPLMSTFLIFIRPSKIYRKEYATVMQRFWKKLTNTIQ